MNQRSHLTKLNLFIAATAAVSTSWAFPVSSDEPLTAIPEGSSLILEHDVLFHRGEYVAIIQNGKVLDWQEVDGSKPYCKLIFGKDIYQVRVLRRQSIPVTYAGFIADDDSKDRLNPVPIYGIKFRARGQEEVPWNPDMFVSCGTRRPYPNGRAYLETSPDHTIDFYQTALKGVVSLKLASPKEY